MACASVIFPKRGRRRKANIFNLLPPKFYQIEGKPVPLLLPSYNSSVLIPQVETSDWKEEEEGKDGGWMMPTQFAMPLFPLPLMSQ